MKKTRNLLGVVLASLALAMPSKAAEPSNNLDINNVTNDFTLTWHHNTTEYMFTANASSGGTVNTSNGWYEANSTSRIEAISNFDHYFTQWSDGDTNKTRDYIVTSPTNLTANFASVPIPRINSFNTNSIGIENLVSNLNYGIQENTNLLNDSWQDYYLFKALGTQTNIPLTSTNKLNFLRVEYKPE